MQYIPEINLKYPVFIQIGNSTGSGFFCRTEKKVFLITALHVLYVDANGVKKIRDKKIRLTCYDKDVNITDPIELLIDIDMVGVRKNDEMDIVLLEIASLTNPGLGLLKGVQINKPKANLVVVPSNHLKKFSDVLVSNEVFIMGFPSSLGIGEKQIEKKQPLLRKGIIAGKNTTNTTIILDCPVYFGNSGGLALEVEHLEGGNKKFSVIGVVSEFVPFVEQLKSLQLGYTNLNFENSGYSVVVPVDTILELASTNLS